MAHCLSMNFSLMQKITLNNVQNRGFFVELFQCCDLMSNDAIMVIMVMRNSTGKRGPMTNAIQSTRLIYIYMYTQVYTSIHSIRTLNEMLSMASTQNIMSMDA